MTHFVVHLLDRPGQPLHERLLLIQPAHIHAQKYHHKEWILLSSKDSGQQGSSWNSRRTSHLLQCSLTQKKKKKKKMMWIWCLFFCTSFPWRSSALWAPTWEVCFPHESKWVVLRAWWDGGRRSERERKRWRNKRGRREWDVEKGGRGGGGQSESGEEVIRCEREGEKAVMGGEETRGRVASNEWTMERWRGDCGGWWTGCHSHSALNHWLLVLLLWREPTSHVNTMSQRHVDDESPCEEAAVTSSERPSRWLCD